MNLNYLVVLIVFIGFIFILLVFSDFKRKLSRIEFMKLAQRLGLDCVAPTGFLAKFPEIKGIYRNFPVYIYMFTERYGEGKSRVVRVHSAIEVKFNNPTNFKLDIYEEGLFSKIYKVFGMQDIIIGNDKFDKEYIIKSNDEETTIQVLTPKICDELLYMADHKFAFGFEILDGKVYYDEATSLTNERRVVWFERILNMMIDLAIEVEKKAQGN
jgi:hypothetical protein